MRIFRYLTGDVLSHTAAVALVLFLVVFSGRFISYLAEAAVGDLTADILLPVMLYKLPSFFELILPLSVFIGILLSLGRLYAESEMVVLRACGLSPLRLAALLSPMVLLITVLVAAMSLQLAPAGSARAQQLLDDPRSSAGLGALTEGRFKKQRRGDVVTYAQTVDDTGVMHNVFVVERQGAGSDEVTITYAETGEIIFRDDISRRYFELRNGTRYRGTAGTPNFDAVSFSVHGELVPEPKGSLRARVKTDAVPSKELWQSTVAKDRATLYWRLSLPVLVPIVTLIAIALSKTDARRGRYARLGTGLAVFLAYFIALTQSRSFIEAGGTWWSLVLSHLLFATLALVLLQWETLSKLHRRGGR